MSMLLGGRGGIKAEMNVTPMIDVLLVLIIMFLVITPLAPRGFPALAPPESDSNTAPAAPRDDIVVSVLLDGTLRLNQESVALADLGSRLRTLFKNHLNHVIFVRGDKGIHFEDVARVIDIAKGAGLDKVALMPGD